MKELLEILELQNAALRHNPAILQENVIEAGAKIARLRKSLKAPTPAATVPAKKKTAKKTPAPSAPVATAPAK